MISKTDNRLSLEFDENYTRLLLSVDYRGLEISISGGSDSVILDAGEIRDFRKLLKKIEKRMEDRRDKDVDDGDNIITFLGRI